MMQSKHLCRPILVGIIFLWKEVIFSDIASEQLEKSQQSQLTQRNNWVLICETQFLAKFDADKLHPCSDGKHVRHFEFH